MLRSPRPRSTRSAWPKRCRSKRARRPRCSPRFSRSTPRSSVRRPRRRPVRASRPASTTRATLRPAWSSAERSPHSRSPAPSPMAPRPNGTARCRPAPVRGRTPTRSCRWPAPGSPGYWHRRESFGQAHPSPIDSPEKAAELAELKTFPRTSQTNNEALFWEAAAGGLRAYQYWNEQIAKRTLEYRPDNDPPRAACAPMRFRS